MGTLRTDPDPCPDGCGGTGWEPVYEPHPTEPDRQIRRVRRCTKCDWVARVRGTAPGVPESESAITWDDYVLTGDNGEAVKHARYFVDGVHPDLYLWGGVGTGKTKLACLCLNELHKAGQAVCFIRVPELLLKLQPGSDLTDQWFTKAADTPVVCLDDVGANQATDFARRMLQSIYDTRQDHRRRTIWTSNLDLDELATFFDGDARLPSRIAGAAKVVELDGKDFRLTKAARRHKAAEPKPVPDTPKLSTPAPRGPQQDRLV